MKCYNCSNTVSSTHHIIQVNKVQMGSDNPENKVPLCFDCHNLWHHSKYTEAQRELKRKLYNHIRPNLDKCYIKSKTGKKPKIIMLIESGEW